MIELIILSREKDREKNGYKTRLKKIKSWVTETIDLETTQGLFKAREDYKVDGDNKELPITILKIQYKDIIILDGFGKDIPSNFQVALQIKESVEKLINLVEGEAEAQGYRHGFKEASSKYQD